VDAVATPDIDVRRLLVCHVGRNPVGIRGEVRDIETALAGEGVPTRGGGRFEVGEAISGPDEVHKVGRVTGEGVSRRTRSRREGLAVPDIPAVRQVDIERNDHSGGADAGEVDGVLPNSAGVRERLRSGSCTESVVPEGRTGPAADADQGVRARGLAGV